MQDDENITLWLCQQFSPPNNRVLQEEKTTDIVAGNLDGHGQACVEEQTSQSSLVSGYSRVLETARKYNGTADFYSRHDPQRRYINLRVQGQERKHTYVGKLYPNAEIGIGYSSRLVKKKSERDYDSMRVGNTKYECIKEYVQTTDGNVYFLPFDRTATVPSLILDKGHELPQARRKYGLNGITRLGKRLVRNACYLLQRDSPPLSLQLGTVTVPAISEEFERAVCTGWSRLVRDFFQALRRWCARFGSDFEYCSVSEVQPARLRKRGEVGLHLHFVFKKQWLENEKAWLLPDNVVREIWQRLLQVVYNRTAEAASGPVKVPHTQYKRLPILKDASAYVSKYISKGSDTCRDVVATRGADYLPSQWFNMSARLRRQIDMETLTLHGEQCCDLLHLSRCSRKDAFAWFVPLYRKLSDSFELLVGFSGRLTVEFACFLRQSYDST